MFHFGLKKLSYNVKFDASCYYPLLFSESNNTRVLCGLNFGWFYNNSISIAWRPSERPEKIDLFACIIYKSVSSFDYISTINTNKEYDFIITNAYKHDFFGIEGYTMDEQNEANRVFKFSTHYKYPRIKIGYTFKSKGRFNILIERN